MRSKEQQNYLPEIMVVGDGPAIGMAEMLRGLVEANLRDSKTRAVLASKARGAVILEASDKELSVTMSFTSTRIELLPFARSGLSVLTGPWMEMTKICSGRISPFRAICGRQLKVVFIRPFSVLLVAAYIMKVPRSVYRERPMAGRIIRLCSKVRSAMTWKGFSRK